MSNPLRNLVIRYLNTGVSSENSVEINRQIQVANLFSFIGYTITFILSVSAFVRGNVLLGSSLFAASALFFGSHLILRMHRFKRRHLVSASVVLCSLLALMIYLVWSGGFSNTGPLWMYIVPPVAFFFAGLKRGLLVLSLFVLAVVTILFAPIDVLDQAHYDFEFKTRLIYSFLTVTALFAFYEFSRQQSYADMKVLNRKLEQQARQDPLTRLPNRRGMMEHLQYERDRSERSKEHMSLMMVDVDHFKQVNDKFGHDGGDVVLRRLAKTFTDMLRKQDIVARWGGEEFLFLLPETNVHEAFILAEKLRKHVERTEFTYQNRRIPVNISIGICQVDDKQTIDEAINLADHFLYQAKTAGRNRTMPPANQLGG